MKEIQFFNLLLDSVVRKQLHQYIEQQIAGFLTQMCSHGKALLWLGIVSPGPTALNSFVALKSHSGGRMVFVRPDSVFMATSWWKMLKEEGERKSLVLA